MLRKGKRNIAESRPPAEQAETNNRFWFCNLLLFLPSAPAQGTKQSSSSLEIHHLPLSAGRQGRQGASWADLSPREGACFLLGTVLRWLSPACPVGELAATCVLPGRPGVRSQHETSLEKELWLSQSFGAGAPQTLSAACRSSPPWSWR